MGGTQQSGFGSWRQCAADLLQQLTSVPTPCSSASLSELLGTLIFLAASEYCIVNTQVQVHIAFCILYKCPNALQQCLTEWAPQNTSRYAATAHCIVNMQMQVYIAHCKSVPTPCSSTSLSEFLRTLLALSAHCIIDIQMQVHIAYCILYNDPIVQQQYFTCHYAASAYCILHIKYSRAL